MRKMWPICILAVAWAVGPAIPALLAGDLLGHGHTDLYPSVWGLWAFAEAQPGLPNRTDLLGFPQGMGYYYSSPIKGWLAALLLPIMSLPTTWNLLVIAARLATVMTSYGAARAWGLGQRGALAAAALYGCSPFFHGYAVEGIAEGSDGWTLALWVWAIGLGRFRLAAIPFALTLLSSWYLGMVALLLMCLAAIRERRALWSLLGLVYAAPALAQFVSAFPGTAPLETAVRAAMGAQLQIPTPGWRPGIQPFAINTYVGGVALVTALASRTRWVIAALIPAFLSLGVGPIYELPVAELVRFPYRWHAATLVLLAPAVAITADRWRWGALVAPLIVAEGLLFSPVEPILPGASATIPAYVDHINGPVLEVPGPVAMPPGQVNRSRGRARFLMYHQTAHRQPSPWVPDFNSVGVDGSVNEAHLETLSGLDRLTGVSPPAEIDWSAFATMGITHVAVHHLRLGKVRDDIAVSTLAAQGWKPAYRSRETSVYVRSDSGAQPQ